MANKGKMTVGEAGRKGGKSTLKKYGPEFYEEIGKKGGQKVRKLIEQGKALQTTDPTAAVEALNGYLETSPNGPKAQEVKELLNSL